MSTLYKTIMSLCEYRGIKGGKMCADIGISKSMLSDLKMGRKKTLSAETLAKIANYFSVSVDSILQAGNFVDEWEIDCWEDWDNAKTEDDQRKILKMHGVPKELVSEYWNMVIKKETPTESVSINDEDIKFALSGGEGVITDEQYEEVKKFVQFIKERDGNDKK